MSIAAVATSVVLASALGKDVRHAERDLNRALRMMIVAVGHAFWDWEFVQIPFVTFSVSHASPASTAARVTIMSALEGHANLDPVRRRTSRVITTLSAAKMLLFAIAVAGSVSGHHRL